MAVGTHDISQLALSKSNGSGLTRIEAEQELREKCKINHNIRLLASYHFGLENRFALTMTPTSIVHWVLDEMIRKKLIAGEQLGVQPELESDNSYFNSYIQRLKVFVENGQALMPKEGEGIDMGEFNGQMPPNGQPPQQGGYMPPPPPPVGYPGQPQQAAPQMPPPGFGGPPQQQFQPPPQQMMPPQQPAYPPPQNQPGYGPPPQQPQQFGAPQGQPGFGPPPGAPPSFPPPGGAPAMMPPQMPPQQQMPQQGAPGVPPTPPPQSPSNRRRGKAEGAPAGAPQAGPPPGQPMPQPGFGAPPQQMQMPQFGAPSAQPQQAQGGTGTDELKAQVIQLKALVEQQSQAIQQLTFMAKINDVAMSYVLRGYFGKTMPSESSQLGLVAAFKEIGLPIPQ